MDFSDIPIEQKQHYYEFSFVPKGAFTGHRVFLDTDTAEKYKQVKKSSKNDTLANLQQKGRVIPIFTFDYSRYLKFNEGALLKSIPPISGTFDEKENVQKYSETIRTSFKLYSRYDIQLPNTTLHLYHHDRFPIIDFEMKGIRYRWVCRSKMHWMSYTKRYDYSLFVLDSDQPSLIDDLENGQVNKNNILVAEVPRTFFRRRSARSSNPDIGNFISTRKVCSFNYASNNIWTNRCRAVLKIGHDDKIEAVTDIDDSLMAYLTMASVIKSKEEADQAYRNAALTA